MGDTIKNLPRNAARKRPAGRSRERNRALLMIGGMLLGLFIFASMLSYSGADGMLLENLSPFDAFRVPFDEAVKLMVAGLGNSLGLLGAFTAHFFINLTLGYFSAVFPILLIMWCGVGLARLDTARPILLSDYALLFAFLLSVLSGVLRYFFTKMGNEWSGIIGAFTSSLLVSLLGTVGAMLLLIVGLGVSVVFAVDLDVQKSVERFRNYYREAIGALRKRRGPPVRISQQGTQSGIPSPTARTIIRTRSGNPPDGGMVTPGGGVSGEETAPVGVSSGIAGAETPRAIGEADGTVPDIPAENALKIDIQDRRGETEDGGGGEWEDERPVVPRRASEEEIEFISPSIDLLDHPRQSENVDREELEANAELVQEKLANFGVEIESVSVTPGPVITLYELVPASGVKVSRIVSLADDLALALAARGIRIIAPIPGKSAVGVEIPNRNPSTVSLRSVLSSSRFREATVPLPVALGKGISGEVIMDDLSRMPHLLIAGATGSGKSVGINTLMASLLFRLHPSEVKFVIIDPKKIELTQYTRLRHHYLAISPDIQKEIITTPEDSVSVLKSVELEMELRYDRLAGAGVRSIQDYNERLKTGRLRNTENTEHRKIPYLIVVIDELADLMLTAARDVEEPIARLAQLARAVGIHLVLATQRPSVDVITGVIKANFPARIAFQVSSKIDSRTILDMNGAEQLLGSGDMLYLPAGSPKPMRIQNAFISGEEIERLTDYIAGQEGFSTPYMLPSVLERKKSLMRGGGGQRDEFFEEAARLIVRHQQGSVSLLQRRLKVGYSRAARLVDELEMAGIVGPYDGSKAREVLLESDAQLDELLRNLE